MVENKNLQYIYIYEYEYMYICIYEYIWIYMYVYNAYMYLYAGPDRRRLLLAILPARALSANARCELFQWQLFVCIWWVFASGICLCMIVCVWWVYVFDECAWMAFVYYCVHSIYVCDTHVLICIIGMHIFVLIYVRAVVTMLLSTYIDISNAFLWYIYIYMLLYNPNVWHLCNIGQSLRMASRPGRTKNAEGDDIRFRDFAASHHNNHFMVNLTHHYFHSGCEI